MVNALVRELPAEQRQIAWEAAVFVDDNPNAFALPGGKVGVNTGLFTVARDQHQLAAVVAHEIGHVIARHHDERITRQYGAAGALQVVGSLLGARYGEGIGNAAMQGGHAVIRVMRNPKVMTYLIGLSIMQGLLSAGLMDDDDEAPLLAEYERNGRSPA